MKRKCIHCGKTFEENESTICPICSKENNTASMSDSEIHVLHQECHSQINKNRDIKNSALTFIVTGSILLIVGLIFLFLSFRRNVIGIRHFTPGSTEFVICVIALVSSITLLSLGTYKLIKSLSNLHFYSKVINDTKR